MSYKLKIGTEVGNTLYITLFLNRVFSTTSEISDLKSDTEFKPYVSFDSPVFDKNFTAYHGAIISPIERSFLPNLFR